MNKLFYIANIRMPTEKAHGVQIMKMCDAFSDIYDEVVLLVPNRQNRPSLRRKDPFIFYNVPKSFNLKRLFTINWEKLGFFRFYVQYISFSIRVFFYVVFANVQCIYSRYELPLFLLSLFGKNIVWEVHSKHNTKIYWWTAGRAEKIIVISEKIKKYLTENGVEISKIYVAHDGVDLQEFVLDKNKKKLRMELQLPGDKKIISYVGKMSSMGESKGVEGIIQAYSKIYRKRKDVLLLLVGLNDDEFEKYTTYMNREKLPTEAYLLVGHVRHADVSKYLMAVDVLVMNYINTKNFFSPLKLFEYMASGTPIVTSGLSNLREVLSDKEAYFFKPSDIESLASDGMEKALCDKKAFQKAERASKKVKAYTWMVRAKNIFDHIQKK